MALLFIYIAISLFKYITTDRINYYEVVEGTSSDETYKSYKGIALRKEVLLMLILPDMLIIMFVKVHEYL